MAKGNYRHGHSNTPEYAVWSSMKSRCSNPNSQFYKRYGGRGIKVCDRWTGKDGFKNFLEDVGFRPAPDLTLDRYPNNDGNYEPGNVRWATREDQANNRKNTVILNVNGVNTPVAILERELGLKKNVLLARLSHNIPIQRAIMPVMAKKNAREGKCPSKYIKKGSKYSPLREEWTRLNQSGLSYDDIAKKYGCVYGTVRSGILTFLKNSV